MENRSVATPQDVSCDHAFAIAFTDVSALTTSNTVRRDHQHDCYTPLVGSSLETVWDKPVIGTYKMSCLIIPSVLLYQSVLRGETVPAQKRAVNKCTYDAVRTSKLCGMSPCFRLHNECL